jgi:mannose-1-phosphate guanylyltransferase
MITQAFVLGAGRGKRLRPLTETLPKPLMPVFGKPLITFALDHLCGVGVESFVINTHHLGTEFERFFAEGTYAGHPVKLVHEPDLLETGGGIKNVERWLGTKPFIVYSGDLLTDIRLEPLIEEHFRQGNDVTLALRETGLAADIALDDGCVVDIQNRYGHLGKLDYANVSIWSNRIFERILPGKKISFIPVLTEWIGKGGKIGGMVLDDGEWFNIGSRAQYLAVHHAISERQWKPHYLRTPDWPQQVGRDAIVDPSARLSGFYSVGEGSRVGAEATVDDTILWTGAQVASHSHLRNCIVRCHQKAEGTLNDVDI